MTKHIRIEDYYPKLISLIKADNISEILNSPKSEINQLDEKKVLDCVVAISQLAYKDVQKGEPLKSSPGDVARLTEFFCSLISSPPVNIIKYLTSLYHITYFLLNKNHLEHMISIFKTILLVKHSNPKMYEEKGRTLHEHFIPLLSKTIFNMVSSEASSINLPVVTELFRLLLEIMINEKTLSNGTLFLKTVLQISQTASKKDKQIAVRIITTSLALFYSIHKIKDTSLFLPILFQIYKCFFTFQLQVTGYCSALGALDSHLNETKWKFSENSFHGECFHLLCNATELFSWNSTESTMLNKILDNNRILKLLKSSGDPIVINACVFMMTVLVNSLKIRKESTPVPQSCVEPFIVMVLKLNSILCEDSVCHRSDLVQCLCECLVLISDADPQYNTELLKSCVPLIVKAESSVLELLQTLRTVGHANADSATKIILVRCANLVRAYHLSSLPEEVIRISLPVCKYICSLPSTVFEEDQNQLTTEICFAFLVNALGTKQLDRALECIAVWLLKCPQNAKRAFKLWADLKHNSLCEGRLEYLDMTVWSILVERKSKIESNWLSYKLSSRELGSLLVEELKTYAVNKSLCDKPVIAATNALQTLDTDCLTQAKGLVIAMDTASATKKFSDECLAYHKKSKSLIKKLRKEEKLFDAVDFNCCMGDLQYAQLRCELKCWRQECESEVLRFSTVSHEPLVAELPENRPDPNDTCDVTTSYNNLSLTKQRKLIENMETALRHWKIVFEMLQEVPNTVYDIRVTLKNIREAGFLLRLYCEGVKEAEIWHLLYNTASLAGDDEMIVNAVGGIMNTGEDINEEWLQNAKIQLKSPGLSDKVLSTFLLNTALYNLHHNKVKDGVNLLVDMEKDVKKKNVHFVHFLMTIGKYQKVIDKEKYNYTFNLSPSYRISFHRALSYLLYLSEEKARDTFVEKCQIHLKLFGASCLLGESSWSQMQPREARYYLKSQLTLAQKLALPLRSAQLLVLLAWVDLDTGLVDDFIIKLEGLEDLLGLCGTPSIYGQSTSPCSKLSKALLLQPDYLSHSDSCSCFPCTNVEYRRLVLETVTLRATFCTAFRQFTDALQCFKVAIEVQENIRNLDNNEIQQSCARMWVRYADAVAKSDNSKYEEQLSANKKALELLTSVQDPIILKHAFDQKSNLQTSLIQCQYKPISARCDFEVEKTPSKIETPYVFKTPSTRKAKEPLSVISDNITPITPFARPERLLKMPSSGEENTPPVSKTKRKTKTLPKFVLETPQAVPKSTKISKTPFVIVDDDGNAVGVSSSKTLSNMKIKMKENVKSTKKKLFPFNNFDYDSKSNQPIPIDTTSDEIVRKSVRNTTVKSYGRSKVTLTKDKKHDNMSKNDNNKDGLQEKQINNPFVFDQMKEAVDNLEVASSKLPKSKNKSKILSSSLVTNKDSKTRFNSNFSSSSRNDEVKASKTNKTEPNDESDCDIIEGTPPVRSKRTAIGLKPKRATRSSNK